MKKKLHTPEGVRDIYNVECGKKLALESRLKKVFHLYGYHDIQTPTIEYFDVFREEIGTTPANDLYKFFDKDGNTLVLRPDITPSIARASATLFKDENLPIRLCYTGNTYSNPRKLQGKLKEVTQIGAELINDDSSAADAEIIATVVDSFKALGIDEFQIEIGQIDYFKGIVAEAGITEAEELQIKEYINIKNFFGLEEYLKKLDLSPVLKKAFLAFDSLFGGESMLEEAEKLVTNPVSLAAVHRLQRIYKALCCYGYDKYIGFDLSMLNGYNYYTGVIFRGYTYGTGDAVVKGGRYNNLLKQFGKDAPSIGFAFTVEELIMALSRQNIEVSVEYSNTIILYDIENQEPAISLGKSLRQNDKKIELIRKSVRKSVEDYLEYAKREHFSGLFYFENSDMVKVFDLVSGDENEMAIASLK